MCAVALSFCGGCSDDDEKAAVEVSADELEGRWELVMRYDGEHDTIDEEWGEECGRRHFMEFLSGGEAYVWSVENGEEQPKSQLRYSVESARLYLSNPAFETGRVLRFEFFSHAEMILSYAYSGDFGGAYSDREYYRRVM